MKDLLLKMLDTRWGSTKFWLIVATFSVFTLLLWHGKLSEDNYMILSGGQLAAYLGVNLAQHKTYAKSAGAGDAP